MAAGAFEKIGSATRFLAVCVRWLSGLRDGAVAVEFALIFPVMLLMYIAVVDLTRGVIASRKLVVFSRSVSDLVSQQETSSSVPASKISTIFTAATALMEPFDTGGLTITVSAVDVKQKSDKTCCQALVRWSYTQGGTLRPCTTPLSQVADGVASAPTNIPSSIITANQTAGYGYTTGSTSYLIVADAAYTYIPLFYKAVAWFNGGMKRTTYMVPRSASGAVTLTSPLSPPSGQSGTICF